MADTYASEDWSVPYPTSPQSSFEQPVAIPAAGPSAEPVVCIPVSTGWLRLLHGAIDQLRQPTTWAAATDADMFQALAWVEDLQLLVAMADKCMQLRWSDADCAVEQSTDGGATWSKISGWPVGPPACLVGAAGAAGAAGAPGPASTWRLSGCDLQYSNDGGGTWTTATGWSVEAIQACLTGTPGNPQTVSTAQQACNIASWLSGSVLQSSLSSAATSLTGGATLVNAVRALGGIALGFTLLLDPFVVAAAVFFEAASVIGSTVLNAAAADTTLRTNITCAIYSAIAADGMVTTGNFASILANINAVTYSTPAVVGLLHDYVSNLGFTGINAIQAEGSLFAGDCSGCASGCAPMHAGAVGTGCTWTETGLTASKLTVGGSSGYVGVDTAVALDNTHTTTIQRIAGPVASSPWFSLGFRFGAYTHGGPSQGDNLWINDISIHADFHRAGAHYADTAVNLYAGTSLTGTVGLTIADGDTLAVQYDPSGPHIHVLHNGVAVISQLVASVSYHPIAIGFYAGSVVDNLSVCVT